MPPSPHRIIMAELAGPTDAAEIFVRLGRHVVRICASDIDAAAAEPSWLAAQIPVAQGSLALVIDIAGSGTGPVAPMDWTDSVHPTLQRCFTAVRGFVPALAERQDSLAVLAILPSRSLIADAENTALSVMGRCLLGFFEALKAELLGTATSVTILLTDGSDTTADLVGRVGDALQRAPLYCLPHSITEADIHNLFEPWLSALDDTPSDLVMPPLGPMGEVYRSGGGGLRTHPAPATIPANYQ